MSNMDQSGRNPQKTKTTVQPETKTITAEFIPQPSPDFVITPAIQDLTDRALAYLSVGYSVHLSGPAGTGKTTLALHIASQLARSCTLIHGDDELKGSDLVGRDSGYRRQSVRDNYVSSILKTEETVSVMWTNNRLTTACEQGHTLIYDEFTRSPPAANNILLSVLEEGILNIPSSSQEKGYIKVHPDFRAIFTSNPEEYVGVHKTQDALLDRMITLEVSHHDRETELAIVATKSQRSTEDAAIIVDIIRDLRERLGGAGGPTIRAALAIATITDFRKCVVDANDRVFIATCQDLLYFNAVRQSGAKISRSEIEAIVRKHASKRATATKTTEQPRMAKTDSLSESYSSVSSPGAGINLNPSDSMTERMEATMETVASSLAKLQNNAEANRNTQQPSLAPSALGNKNVAEPLAFERFSDQLESADEVSEANSLRTPSGRALPKPPGFESSAVRLAVSN